MILNWTGGDLGYIGLQPLIHSWGSGGGEATFGAASARGNIDYDQIRVAARTGNGTQLLTWTFPAPVTFSAAGTPGQTAYDTSGNFYWCYATNAWAMIGPGGYSNSF